MGYGAKPAPSTGSTELLDGLGESFAGLSRLIDDERDNGVGCLCSPDRWHEVEDGLEVQFALGHFIASVIRRFIVSIAPAGSTRKSVTNSLNASLNK